MRVTSVEYSMVRVTKPFENDRSTITIELAEGDSVGDAVRQAKTMCLAALKSSNVGPESVPTFERLVRKYEGV